ncbi:hypothetical protein [Bartonella gliris]|uniref:hypothetical protein n=1 Tax=Bartonella gliris TaxID=3004109 RepID=UPI00295EACFF|nr:hypothetical protein [Bartonella gliris]
MRVLMGGKFRGFHWGMADVLNFIKVDMPKRGIFYFIATCKECLQNHKEKIEKRSTCVKVVLLSGKSKRSRVIKSPNAAKIGGEPQKEGDSYRSIRCFKEQRRFKFKDRGAHANYYRLSARNGGMV